MNRFFFWQKWLFGVSLLVITYGLGLAFFSQTGIFDFLLNNQINEAFWGNSTLSDGIVIKFQKFTYGVVGTVAAGWGIMLAFIAYYPFKKKETWAWNSLVLALAIWFFTDTTISIYYKGYSNAIMNTLMFIAFCVPLIATKKDFKSDLTPMLQKSEGARVKAPRVKP